MIEIKGKEKVLHICLYNSFTLTGLKKLLEERLSVCYFCLVSNDTFAFFPARRHLM